MPSFTTLFPPLLPEHFSKDVGRIPSLMSGLGYESMIVGIEKDGVDYPRPDIPMGLLKMQGLRGHLETTVLSFLQVKSKEIDVLNLYHLRRDTIFYGQRYKKHNPDGFLYLKMDSYNEELEEGVKYSSNFLKNAFFKFHASRFLECCDLISVENRRGVELMKRSYPVHAHKIVYLPNGVDLDIARPKMTVVGKGRDASDPDSNILLTVGRLDDPVKNYQDLMAILPALDLSDWRVVIVGRGEGEWEESLFTDHPELKGRVEFTGPISDRKELFACYAKARLYVQPSLHESFGLAMAEAACHGCYLVGTSGMSAFDDLSNDGEYGSKVESGDREALKNELRSLMDNENEGLPSPETISTFARSAFGWQGIAQRLHEEIDTRRTH